MKELIYSKDADGNRTTEIQNNQMTDNEAKQKTFTGTSGEIVTREWWVYERR